MPLALECVCSPDSGVCLVTSLTMVMDFEVTQVGSTIPSSTHQVVATASSFDPSAPSFILLNPTGHVEVDITSWLNYFDTIRVQLNTFASIGVTPSPPLSSYDMFEGHFYIEQAYECHNDETGKVSSWIIKSYSTSPDQQSSCESPAGNMWYLCWAGRGVTSVTYKTGPTGCPGCSTSDGGFVPGVLSDQLVDLNVATEMCLCATGGSGAYRYSIANGHLASGLSLNPTTGCIEGTADGNFKGTPEITFAVEDLGGGGVTPGSTRSVGGYCRELTSTPGNVVRVSGGAWDSSMVGGTIMINGVPRTVVLVMDANHMQVT